MYNKTQLDPKTAFERGIFHRDMFSHYLRWTHILKTVQPRKQNILDIGCGTGNLAEVLYRNRRPAKQYMGIDIRKKTIINNTIKHKNMNWARWQARDIIKPLKDLGSEWDIITCFEVLEHVGKDNAKKLLLNIKEIMNENTTLILSTPNFDQKVGAAKNHIINGVVCEFEFNELKQELLKHFRIERVWGTFASQKDYKPYLSEEQQKVFEQAREYYDVNILSNLMAPLIKPEQARNCLWRLRI